MSIGKVEVRVQTEERLYAINKLASAIEVLSRALSTGTSVLVQNCNIRSNESGIVIDTEPTTMRTEIVTGETEDHADGEEDQ